MSEPEAAGSRAGTGTFRRHLRFGWCTLTVFIAMGLVLESLHGFKLGWYLDADRETRRLMWTLSHSHGALIGLVHLGFAQLLRCLPSWGGGAREIASWSLVASTFLLPGGFFLGGLIVHDGDPSLGVLLVPVGGAALLVAAGTAATAALRSRER